ncbi:hypothetical protein DXG01_000744 [Tephrocybe rancida]|nr:hypothetical protein DXG01_000744 [Tephrocybe rancida]
MRHVEYLCQYIDREFDYDAPTSIAAESLLGGHAYQQQYSAAGNQILRATFSTIWQERFHDLPQEWSGPLIDTLLHEHTITALCKTKKWTGLPQMTNPADSLSFLLPFIIGLHANQHGEVLTILWIRQNLGPLVEVLAKYFSSEPSAFAAAVQAEPELASPQTSSQSQSSPLKASSAQPTVMKSARRTRGKENRPPCQLVPAPTLARPKSRLFGLTVSNTTPSENSPSLSSMVQETEGPAHKRPRIH